MKSISNVLIAVLICCFNTSLLAENKYTNEAADETNSSQKESYWVPLYKSAKDTINWVSNRKIPFPNSGWLVAHNELVLLSGRKGGDIITKKRYSDFELKLEFKMTRLVNSGVKYLVNQMKNNETGKVELIGFEYQIIDDFHQDEIRGFVDEKGSTAALYLLYAPDKNKKLNLLDEWNTMKIRVKEGIIEHWLNGEKVLSADLSSQEFLKTVSGTKFKAYDDFGKMKEGYILLQDHGDQVHFRNIMIREL